MRRRNAVDQGQVLPTQQPRLQEVLERAVHGIALGDHQQPRGVAVQAVHDPGAVRVITAGGAVRERLRKRPALMPARGVHDHPGRLVDHDQGVVLVCNREVCWCRPAGRLQPQRLGRHDHLLTGVHESALLDRAAVELHESGPYQPRRASPRAQPLRQELIEALTRVVGVDRALPFDLSHLWNPVRSRTQG